MVAYSASVPSPAEHRVFLDASCLPACVPSCLAAWRPAETLTDREDGSCRLPGGLAGSGSVTHCLLAFEIRSFHVCPGCSGGSKTDPARGFPIYQLVIKHHHQHTIQFPCQASQAPRHTCARTLRDQDKARGPRKPSGWSARPRDGSRYRLRPLTQGTPGLGHHSSVRTRDDSVRARHAIPIGICGPAGTSSSGLAIAPVRLALPAARPIYLGEPGGALLLTYIERSSSPAGRIAGAPSHQDADDSSVEPLIGTYTISSNPLP